MIDRAAYSYREDPTVPSFPDDAPVIVYDGVCVLCSRWAAFVIARDQETRFVAGQSSLGQALYRHYGLDPENFETWILIDGGRRYVGMAGVAKMLRRWRGAWTVLAVAIDGIPRRVADWCYARIARNRYRIFGRRDICAVPSPAIRARFIAWE